LKISSWTFNFARTLKLDPPKTISPSTFMISSTHKPDSLSHLIHHLPQTRSPNHPAIRRKDAIALQSQDVFKNAIYKLVATVERTIKVEAKRRVDAILLDILDECTPPSLLPAKL
jgi:hypothetical protein